MTVFSPLPAETVLEQRYRLGEVIGRGGMGAVYEAVDLRLNARVALKQILRATPTLRQAFEREAQLLANLRHRALPRVSDYFSEADADFIVMEFIDGTDLRQVLLDRGPLVVDEVLAWGDQLLDVLEYLHGQTPPIIHRDIKPQNIKLTQSGALVLLDFGIAKGNLGAEPTTGASQSVVALTREYAPPEQLLREGTDERSDLFSLAATLYHLLCNQLPVPIDRRISRIQNDQPDPLLPVAQINARVTTAVSDLLHQALSRKAEQRPASAAVFREALRAAAHAQNPLPPGETEIGTAVDEDTDTVPREVDESRLRHPDNPVETSQSSDAPPPGTPGGRSVPSVGRGVAHARTGQMSLQRRIAGLVRDVFDSGPGAWMVWCDPRGDWRPLLERVAADSRLGGFELVVVTEETAGEIGGLRVRRRIQELLDAGESFVLLVPYTRDRLGWIWAQALLAEQIYDRPLFDELLRWGWRPPSASITADEVALLARQGLQHDPTAWGGGNIQPDVPLLLNILAGGAVPERDEEYLLDRTIEAAGLPERDQVHLDRWRVRSLAHLLVTQAQQIAPRLVSPTQELLVAEGQRPLALVVLAHWADSLRLSRRLPELIAEADRVADLGSLLGGATVKHGPFFSRVAEQTVFVNTCLRLAQKSGKELLQSLADMEGDLQRHTQGFWGERSGRTESGWTGRTIPWGELLRLSRAACGVLTVAPEREWTRPDDAISWYTDSGWRLDAAGEEILRNLTRTTPELLGVIAQLRNAYRTRWEKTLIQWSDVWSAAGCPNPALPTAGMWLKEQLETSRPTAIMFIDAFRYDLGASLVEAVNAQEGAIRAAVRPARAPLPSVTALGMGMALPIQESNLRAEIVGGSWQLIDNASGLDLSRAENRRTWLSERAGVLPDSILALDDVSRGQIPAPAKNRKRLVVTDMAIDQLGHDDELERLGSSAIIDRYREAIMRLRDSGWLRVLIVTDHGYIHWSGSDERRLQPPISGPAYRSRRALAYPAHTSISDTHVSTPGGQWKVVPAPGAACWSAYGGLGYFHGGASLQEWIIPCVQIDWPTTAQPVQVSLQPLMHVLSVKPRIVLNIERTSLLLEDTLPRQIDVIIRHATSRVILFRSAQTEVTPGQSQIAVTLRLTPGGTAEWEAPLRIEVRDALTEELLDAVDSSLRVHLDDW
jgi:serine/threonine protein kinase